MPWSDATSRPGAGSHVPEAMEGGRQAAKGDHAAFAAGEAVTALLQLFDLCKPGEDAMVSRADLERVLGEHLGREEDVARVLGGIARGAAPAGRLDFLSYWQGMDHFLADAGALSQRPRAGGEDIVQGMVRFRGGVLEIWRRQGSQGALPSGELLGLLQGIRRDAQEPQYWDQVMEAVPREGAASLTLPDVAEAVIAWLRDHLLGGAEEEACDGEAEEQPPLCQRLSLRGYGGGGGHGAHGAHPAGALPLDGSTDSSHSAASVLHNAQELLEVVAQAVKPQDSAARQAIASLTAAHDTLRCTLQSQETQVGDLQESLELLSEKRARCESDLAHAHEQYEDVRDVAQQRDDQRRRADGLEAELVTWKKHCAETLEELNKLKARHADVDRERTDSQRRDWQWRERCEQLEQAADKAEGQAQWLRSELERQASKLRGAEGRTLSAEIDATRLRRTLRATSAAMSSYACCAEEAEACASELQQRLSDSPAPASPAAGAGADAADLLEQQLHSRQAQLQGLIVLRDELLEAKERCVEQPSADDECDSPRQHQMSHHCNFLSLQVRALVQYARELEKVLDAPHGAQHLNAVLSSPSSVRLLTIQWVHDECTAMFSELSQKIYTVEVQKADVEQELERCHARLARQGGLKKSVAAFETTTEPSTTTDSRSMASGSGQDGHGPNQADADGFLFSAARQSSGLLRTSPKNEARGTLKTTVNRQDQGGGAHHAEPARECSGVRVGSFRRHDHDGAGDAGHRPHSRSFVARHHGGGGHDDDEHQGRLRGGQRQHTSQAARPGEGHRHHGSTSCEPPAARDRHRQTRR